MSYAEFQSVREVKSNRKPRRCDWCGELVEVGAAAVVISGKWDGDFYTFRSHPECRTASAAWWKAHPREDEGPEPGTMLRGKTDVRWS
jgi:hypothetical protein